VSWEVVGWVGGVWESGRDFWWKIGWGMGDEFTKWIV